MRFLAILFMAFLLPTFTFASEVKGTINYGQTVNGIVAGNGVDTYSFNVTKGSTFVISLSETGNHEPNFSPLLEIAAPENAAGRANRAGSGGAQPLYVRAVQSDAAEGIWTAKISRADSEGRLGGNYALTLEEVAPKNKSAVISPGKSYSGSIYRGSV